MVSEFHISRCSFWVILTVYLHIYLYTHLVYWLVYTFESFKLITTTPWCSGYHYCTTSFNKVWTQILRRFKPCSRRVGDLRGWESLTMVLLEIRRKRLSSVNHTTKTIHQHHHLRTDTYFFPQPFVTLHFPANKFLTVRCSWCLTNLEYANISK